MFSFLRKIRKRLLAENLLSKYLVYALGEIVLVVIGILIALQINMWNEHRKERLVEKAYYCRLLEDLELEKEMIQKSHEEAELHIRKGKQLIKDMNRGSKSRAELVNEFILVVRGSKLVPPKAAYTDLLSSGNLQLLRDIELKNSLTAYYGRQEDIVSTLNVNREAIFDRVRNYDPLEFGVQDLESVSEKLGEEVLALLPKNDWASDPNHPQFREVESDLVMTLTALVRHQEHLNEIMKNMKDPYVRLLSKCSAN
jgi:hypothetical protein